MFIHSPDISAGSADFIIDLHNLPPDVETHIPEENEAHFLQLKPFTLTTCTIAPRECCKNAGK